MEFSGKRQADIIVLAIDKANKAMDDFTKTLGDGDDGAVIDFLETLSIVCKLTALRTRIIAAKENGVQDIEQALREDCVKRRISFEYLLNTFFEKTMAKDDPKALAFLTKNEFFEYPESKMESWRIDLTLDRSDFTQ